MRKTTYSLVAFTVCLAACASKRPDFGQAANLNAPDASGTYDDKDAEVSSAVDVGSSQTDTSGGDDDGGSTTVSDSNEDTRSDTGSDGDTSAANDSNGPPSDDTASDSTEDTAGDSAGNDTDTDAAEGDSSDADGADGGSNNGAAQDNGESCERAADCASGFCVDDVCCDTSCDGACAACDQADGEGTCTATESDEACGTLSCPADSECLTYEGVGLNANCAALNSCVEEAACTATPVAADTPCQEGAGTCDGEGECIVPDKKALGEACAAADECGAGHCVSSVSGEQICCDTACDGVCEGCGTNGRCDSTPDDDAACEAVECADDTTCSSYPEPLDGNRCASFGQCVTAAAYCTPEHAEEGVSCGENRACDGSGECELDCPTHQGADRTCSAACPCDAGAGVCSSNAQCDAGLVCVTGGGIKYGFTGNTCLPAHCDNDVQDASESSIDCGEECGCTATLEFLAEYASPAGISDDGNKVVGYSSNSSGRRAYLWDETGIRTELSNDHTAEGISGDGRVIIGVGDVGPVRWVNGGQPERILPERFTSGAPYDVSRTGSTIVGRGYTEDGDWEAFVWTNGATTSVSGFYDFVSVSADGSLVLGHEVGEAGVRGKPAFWSASSGTTALTLPGEWDVEGVYAMSRNGEHIVGRAMDESPFPFVWSQAGVVQLTADAYGSDVSNDGVVVGQLGRGGVPGRYWSPGSNYASHLVEDLMLEHGLELGDTTIWAARLITPDGKTMIGESIDGLWRLRLH